MYVKMMTTMMMTMIVKVLEHRIINSHKYYITEQTYITEKWIFCAFITYLLCVFTVRLHGAVNPSSVYQILSAITCVALLNIMQIVHEL